MALVAFARFCKLDRVEGKGHWAGFDIELSEIGADEPALDVQQATSSLMLMQVAQRASLLFECKDGFQTVRFRLSRKDGVPSDADVAPAAPVAVAAAAPDPEQVAAKKRAKLATAHLRLRAAEPSPVVVAAYPSRTIDSLDTFRAWVAAGGLDPDPEQRLVRVDVVLSPENTDALLDARALVLGLAAKDTSHKGPLHSDASRQIRSAEEMGLDSQRYYHATRTSGMGVALPPCGPAVMATTLRTLSRLFAAVAAVPEIEELPRTMAKAAAGLLAIVASDVNEVSGLGTGFVALSACAYATLAWHSLRNGRLYRPVGVQPLGDLQQEAEALDGLTKSMWLPAGSSFMDDRFGSATLSKAAKRARTPAKPSSSAKKRAGSTKRGSRPPKGKRLKKTVVAAPPVPAPAPAPLTAMESAVSAQFSGAASADSIQAPSDGLAMPVVVSQGQSKVEPLAMASVHVKQEPPSIFWSSSSSSSSAAAMPPPARRAGGGGAGDDDDDDCVPVSEGFITWPEDSD